MPDTLPDESRKPATEANSRPLPSNEAGSGEKRNPLSAGQPAPLLQPQLLQPNLRRPEIMSPAGYWPQLHAAIEAGADSVYFGLHHFSARAKVGFGLQELPEVFRTLHRRGVRGFVAFNTLVFERELQAAAEAIAAIAEAGADALIVQDWAVLQLARRIAPGLELHASTQMSITSADGARLAAELGVQRVTLARELSLKEIAAIAAAVPVEVEVFVHGALCVAYSGQCFSSEAWGGRSANRGQCAQACRMPYELVVDGEVKPLGDARYLLSPEDLYTLAQVPQLVAAGVGALKIEGRYKEAEYVAATTKAYRAAVDAAMDAARKTTNASSSAPAAQGTFPASYQPPAEEALLLQQVYSRGMGPHFLTGTNHQAVVKGASPRHRGLFMGRVVEVLRDAVIVTAEEAHQLSPLKPGDGVVFDASLWRSPQEPEEGGRLYGVRPWGNGPKSAKLRLEFGHRDLDLRRIRVGDLLWRTDDPAVEKALAKWTQASQPLFRLPLQVEVEATVGQPPRIRWRVDRLHPVEVCTEGDSPLAAAQNRAPDEQAIAAQLGRLGGTAYQLEHCQVHLQGNPFLPASLLNDLRRQAVAALDSQLAEGPARPGPVARPAETLAILQQCRSQALAEQPQPNAAGNQPQLHLLLRSPAQLEAALALPSDLPIASLTLDYLDLYGLKPSVERVKQTGRSVRVATPRVLKPGEEKIADFLLRLETPLLVRAAGLLHRFRTETQQPLFGDFSLNAANSLAAKELLQMGLQRLTPTHDLNAKQVEELALAVGGHRFEVIVYQHLPVFHMEHCVFCRFLSTGTSFVDCGRPCEAHQLELQDTQGRTHPVLADIGCRNTVFGAEAQQASQHLAAWLAAGIQDLRLEFAHETGTQVKDVVQAFAQALKDWGTAGQVDAASLANRLASVSPQGITTGSLFVPAQDARLPILQ